jgi:hypothetical protein
MDGLFNGRPGDSYPRVQHSGLNEELIETLAAAVIRRADPGTISVRTWKGRMANQFSFAVGGKPCLLTYGGAKVLLRVPGRPDETFSNGNVGNVRPVFARI